MAKIKIDNWVFDASAQEIEFSDYVSIDLPAVLIITNVADNVQIYNSFIAGKGGTVATNVLTLEYDTTSMDDADELQIWYWDVTTDEPVEVTNFPADYPLPAAQVTTLTPPAAITGFLTESDFDTKAGSLTEGAPATDTASSGLNGRLQRVAQRISSLITALGSPFQAGGSIGNTTFASTIADGADVSLGAKADAEASSNTGTFSLIAFFKRLINTTLAFGQKAKANSISVTLANDQDAITANAGTNLNTSALALEAGNLASIKTAVEVIDNFISGSKGLVTEDNSASIKTAVEALSTNLGAVADAIVAAGATGTLSAKLRRATQGLEDLKTAIVLAAGNNNIGDVDVASLPALPSGTNNIGDVDVLTLPADPLGANADASVAAGAVGSISAKLRRATQGLEDLKTGIILAAGTAAIGKLAANSGVDIGDVDVTSVVPGTAASNLGKAEDAIFGDGDVGVMALGVRKNTAASTSGADGDYQPLITNTRGAQWIAVEDGAGGQVTSFGGGTQYTEDVAAAADPIGGALIAVRRDTLSITEVSADGDNIALKATNKGQLHIAVSDGSGNLITSRSIGTQRHIETAAANGDRFLTGQGSQTALSNNILLETAGTGWLDTLGYKSMVVEIIVAAGTVTAGVITFEQANDPNATSQTFSLSAQTLNSVSATLVTSETVSAVPGYTAYNIELRLRYIRFRISIGITGTTTGVQAFTTLSPQRISMVQSVRNSIANDFVASISNAGTFATQESGAALTALQLMDDVVFTDDAAFTPGTSKVQAIGLTADEASTDSIDEGDIGLPRMTLDRKQITVNYSHSTGGWTPGRIISAATTNATSVKGSAGQIGYIHAINLNAAVRYLKIYNKATSPTVGTDTPVQTFPIPASTTGAGFVFQPTPGMDLTTGVAMALTTGIADADTGAVAANEIIINYGYK